MAFYGVVPIANVHRAARAEAYIDWNKAEIRREDEVANILLVETKVVFIPTVDFDAVCRLVTRFDESTLQLVRKRRKVNELLTAGTGVRPQTCWRRMLLRVRWIERVKRGRINRMTGNVLPPVVKRYTPRVGAVVRAETRESMSSRLEAVPTTVLLPDRTVRRFNLRVEKDGIAKN